MVLFVFRENVKEEKECLEKVEMCENYGRTKVSPVEEDELKIRGFWFELNIRAKQRNAVCLMRKKKCGQREEIKMFTQIVKIFLSKTNGTS